MSARWNHEAHVRVGDPCFTCGTGRACYQRRHTDPAIAELVAQAKESAPAAL